MKSKDQKIKLKILEKALLGGKVNGWNDNLMAIAASEAGVDQATVMKIFPKGILDLTDFFFSEINRQTQIKLSGLDLNAMAVRERVASVVRKRLELMAPNRHVVRMIFSMYLKPHFACGTVRNLYSATDFIWRAIGDKSTDFNFYTKRALLAPVLVTTLLFWLNDDSIDYVETWAFLDRRIYDVLKIQTLRRRVENIISNVPLVSAFSSLARFKKMA